MFAKLIDTPQRLQLIYGTINRMWENIKLFPNLFSIQFSSSQEQRINIHCLFWYWRFYLHNYYFNIFLLKTHLQLLSSHEIKLYQTIRPSVEKRSCGSWRQSSITWGDDSNWIACAFWVCCNNNCA